jgi:[acyl-carrier-protein] S-malonyltransferase
MGTALAEKYAAARAVYERADQLLGLPLAQIMRAGPAAALDDTAMTQPAIYTATLALWQVLAPRLEAVRGQIAYLAGHSLGEFSALAVAGAITVEDGLRLVRCRGEAMRDAGTLAPGGMVAVIGLEDAVVAEVVAAANGESQRVWMANLNAPGQVVLAGTQEGLERATVLAKERQARRVLPLAVSVACHTPLMRAAAERLATALEATPFQRPWAPVVSNALAAPLSDPAAIKAALLQQLTSPVRWVESVRLMAAGGVTAVLEVGPKAVLVGLIGRIEPGLALHSVTDVASLEGLAVEEWSQ